MSEIPEEKPLGEPLIGSWTIEKNPPYGVVIRNISPDSLNTEYHFWFESNGWITAKNKTSVNVLNTHGKTNGAPHLCDKKSIVKMERIELLRNKNKDLTNEEAKELCILCGIIKE